MDEMERHHHLDQMIRVLNLGQCLSSRSFGPVKRFLFVPTRVDELLIAEHTSGMRRASLEYPPGLLCNIRGTRGCVDNDEFFTNLLDGSVMGTVPCSRWWLSCAETPQGSTL